MNTLKTSRRKFLGRSGSLAVGLPLAAAIPTAIEELASPKKVEASSTDDSRQFTPTRSLPNLAIGTTRTPITGLYTDGQTDCSLIINKAILNMAQSGGGTVVIPWQAMSLPNSIGGHQCVYAINPQANGGASGVPYYGVLLQSNVRIECEPGVKLQSTRNNTGSSPLIDRAYMFYGALGIDGQPLHDAEISNCWLVGERYTHTYSTGTATDEHWYGISLLGVHDVNIRATYVSDCTGDGICIGSLGTTAPYNITLCDVVSTGNRRQGLSITAGDSISVYDSEFSYTAGTAPSDGIDIEPDALPVSNVIIENCVIRGNGGNGIEINAHSANVTNVNVVNCLIDYNFYAGFMAASSNNFVVDTGTVYGNAFFQNNWYGIRMVDTTKNYIVGGYSSKGYDSNTFANNGTHSFGITYPNPTQTNTPGYVTANNAMYMTSGSLSQANNNTIQWNLYP